MFRTRHLACLLAALAAAPAAVGGGVEVGFQFKLSDFGGPIPFQGARVRVDAKTREAYVLHGLTLRIFNASGMEAYSIALDPERGRYVDVAVEPGGDILLLGAPVEAPPSGVPLFFVDRLDFRGAFEERIQPRTFPRELADFAPNSLYLRGGDLFLLSTTTLDAVVLGTDGTLRRTTDLADVLGIEEKDRGNLHLGGVEIDADGRMLVTVPTHFAVYIVAPDGAVTTFGRVGSGAGQFGVIGGIACDEAGLIYVADQLRSVVIVFDRNGQFLHEFGGYDLGTSGTVRPVFLAVAPGGQLFVSQLRQMGVSVFTVTPS